MKNSSYQPNMQQLYDQSLFNRYHAYKVVNLNFSKFYRVKVLLSAFLLLSKLLLSRFFSVKTASLGSIFVAWSPLHKRRAKDLSERYELIEFLSLSFAKEQLRFFASISLRECYELVSVVKRSKVSKLEDSSRYITDSFAYRIWFILDYLALRSIVLRANNIFVAGHGDRPTLFISKLCEGHQIQFSMLQHGVLGKKEGWIPLKTDRFYYLYPFSKPYVPHLITVSPDTELIYLPKKASSLKLALFSDGQFQRNIAYATSPADSEKDVEILEKLVEVLKYHDYNLLIYPHPLENETTYQHFKKDESIFISRKRHSNIDYMISRYSTLGIEYYDCGIAPVFLNYENHRMDFLEEKKFLVFQDSNSFHRWLGKMLTNPEV